MLHCWLFVCSMSNSLQPHRLNASISLLLLSKAYNLSCLLCFCFPEQLFGGLTQPAHSQMSLLKWSFCTVLHCELHQALSTLTSCAYLKADAWLIYGWTSAFSSCPRIQATEAESEHLYILISHSHCVLEHLFCWLMLPTLDQADSKFHIHNWFQQSKSLLDHLMELHPTDHSADSLHVSALWPFVPFTLEPGQRLTQVIHYTLSTAN